MDASLQLQVSQAAPATVSDATMADQSRAAAFKQVWLGLRDQRTGYVTAGQNSVASLSDLCDSITSLMSYFQEQAIQGDPTLQGLDPYAIASQAVTGDPSSSLAVLWSQYQSSYNDFAAKIGDAKDYIAECNANIAGVDSQVAALKTSYEDFSSNSQTPVPSPDDLEADVNAGDALYAATPSNTMTVDAQLTSQMSDEANAQVLNAITQPTDPTSTVSPAVQVANDNKIKTFSLGIFLTALGYLLFA